MEEGMLKRIEEHLLELIILRVSLELEGPCYVKHHARH
jgi:hypothetical protein